MDLYRYLWIYVDIYMGRIRSGWASESSKERHGTRRRARHHRRLSVSRCASRARPGAMAAPPTGPRPFSLRAPGSRGPDGDLHARLEPAQRPTAQDRGNGNTTAVTSRPELVSSEWPA